MKNGQHAKESMTVREIREVRRKEPNKKKKKEDDLDSRLAAPLAYDDGEESEDEGLEENEDEILAADEEIEIDVAADTGCVDHCVGPDDIPGSIPVVKVKGKTRNFVGAGGGRIRCYGEAGVELVQKNGKVIQNKVQVADVCRPLHAVSKITDNGHDFLFKKGCAYAVPEGVFDKILAQVTHVATYPRQGGLWVAKVRARVPRSAKMRSSEAESAGFGRQGQGR